MFQRKKHKNIFNKCFIFSFE